MLLVELHALIIGLRLAWDYGYCCMLVKPDCLNALTCVLTKLSDVLPDFYAFATKFQELLRRRWHIHLDHGQRSANMVVDFIAKSRASEQ